MIKGREKVIAYDTIKDIILSQKNPRTRAMVAVQYGLAVRAGELIRYKHKEIETPGLLKENISFEKGVVSCEIPNFKNTGQPFKVPYIVEVESFLYEPLMNWLNVCGNQVFPIRIARWHQIMRKALPVSFTSHCLRHSRATHLVEIFGYDAYEIKAFLGHAKLDTSSIYVSRDLKRSAFKISNKIKSKEV